MAAAISSFRWLTGSSGGYAMAGTAPLRASTRAAAASISALRPGECLLARLRVAQRGGAVGPAAEPLPVARRQPGQA